MCILLHNNRVGISGNIIYFFYMFCPNTGTKFREPYHSNHVIPRLDLNYKTLGENIMLHVRPFDNIAFHPEGFVLFVFS